MAAETGHGAFYGKAPRKGAEDVHLRQVTNPGLNIWDRCVSCHVGMAPGEQGITGDRVLAAHKAVVHQPAEFGCTVCHGGQGRATKTGRCSRRCPFSPADDTRQIR
ncbi:MAG: hypothetical protein IPJ07_17990 [Acidobacteria bacterium]|nr:hypothetical protein [Acidobacteriota bacterium]